MKVHVVGSGAREHAVARTLACSDLVTEVVVNPGNGGVATEGGKVRNSVETDDIYAADLVFVGPEQPLADGLVDKLTAKGVTCFGPTAAAAQIETCKSFSKKFMVENNIPTAKFEEVTNLNDALAYANNHKWDQYVIKKPELAAGKGVYLPKCDEEAKLLFKQLYGKNPKATLILEERLSGYEVSAMGFCDGKTVVSMPLCQDHKRVGEFDRFSNTGGMGAVCPLAPHLLAKTGPILQQAIDGLAAAGTPFIGVLFAGFMVTANDELKVLEFNARMGDPETQTILPLLESDLCQIVLDCCHGKLSSDSVTWKQDTFSVTIVACAAGYPDDGVLYKEIRDIAPLPTAKNLYYSHASTALKEDGGLRTNGGGRVISITNIASSIDAAAAQGYRILPKVHFKDILFRQDIAARHYKPVKIAVLGSTRGTDLQAIIDNIANGQVQAKITHVISNAKKAYILERARNHGLNAIHISGKDPDFEAKVLSTLLEDPAEAPDLVLLIGFMKIISSKLINPFRGRILNVHPSLLPDFAGGMDLNVHEAVLSAGRTESGCTVHQVTEEVDSGEICVQLRCTIAADETADSLKTKVQSLEGDALCQAIYMYQTDRLPGSSEKSTGLTYKDAGVDVTKGYKLVDRIKPLAASTARPGATAELGGFGGIFQLSQTPYLQGSEKPLLISSSDGVGTKLLVAQAANKHSTIGIDLVAMSVNDLLVQCAEPLFFQDYFATGNLDVDTAASVVEGIAEGCRQAGCALVGGETAEMPDMYAPGHYDLAGFAVGACLPSQLLPKLDAINAGDVLVGFKSSGIHSNGYSLVRKIVSSQGLKWTDPPPFSSPHSTLADALLEPTKIYIKSVLPLLQTGKVHAAAHITGGSFEENIPRALPKHLGFKLNEWELPPMFTWLASMTSREECFHTFNCGVGLVLVVSPENVSDVLTDESFVIGTVTDKV